MFNQISNTVAVKFANKDQSEDGSPIPTQKCWEGSCGMWCSDEGSPRDQKG